MSQPFHDIAKFFSWWSEQSCIILLISGVLSSMNFKFNLVRRDLICLRRLSIGLLYFSYFVLLELHVTVCLRNFSPHRTYEFVVACLTVDIIEGLLTVREDSASEHFFGKHTYGAVFLPLTRFNKPYAYTFSVGFSVHSLPDFHDSPYLFLITHSLLMG